MGSFGLSSKLYIGFGVVVLILALVAGNAYLSLGRVTESGETALKSSADSRFMTEKEGDHLRWINDVQNLFLRNLASLEIQKDPHKCGLGEFIYGDEAAALAGQDSELAKLLEEIKAPHGKLHESASLIGDVWKRNHPGLALSLAARLDDHRRWAGALANSLLTNKEITVQVDPGQCDFGKWLAGEEAQKIMQQWPWFKEMVAELTKHHERLHETARKIKQAQLPEERIRIYEKETLPELEVLADLFGKIQAREKELEDAQLKARDIFLQKTLPALAETQEKLKAIIANLIRRQDSSKGKRAGGCPA